MKTYVRYACLLGVLMLRAGVPARAGLIFESAPASETDCSCGGPANEFWYITANFQVTEPVETGSIGGRFRDFEHGAPIFGAIVRIDGESDRIAPNDFESGAVLGATLIDLPPTTKEVSANLRVTLTPGWYALVFGAGRFGATGSAGVVGNATLDGASLVYRMRTGTGAISIESYAARLFVTTTPIPELSILTDTATLGVFSLRAPALHRGEVLFKADDDLVRMTIDGGNLQSVVQHLQTIIPERTDSFSVLERGSPIRDGSVAFHGGRFNVVNGLYTDVRGKLERVIDSTMAVPGGTDLFQFPQFGMVASLSGTSVAFAGRNGTTSMGAYVWRNGTIDVIANASTLIPGTGFAFTILEDLVIAVDGDDVGFAGGNTDQGILGVFRHDGVTLETIYDNSVPLPDGTPFDLGGVVRMREDRFSFVGCSNQLVNCGFYSDADGPLQTVASFETLAPESTTTFSVFFLPHAFDGRHVVFTARFEGTRNGIFTDLPGELARVVATGDVVGNRTVDRLASSGHAIDGNKIALQVTFDDFSEAIVLAKYPPVPGDVDDNSFVDLRDAARLQNCFGQTVLLTDPTPCRNADFNGDTSIALSDYKSWADCGGGPGQPSPCRY